MGEPMTNELGAFLAFLVWLAVLSVVGLFVFLYLEALPLNPFAAIRQLREQKLKAQAEYERNRQEFEAHKSKVQGSIDRMDAERMERGARRTGGRIG